MDLKHQYSLEKGSKRYLCPDWVEIQFVGFIDPTTSEYLPEQDGFCHRERK
jgi:hypothetical protein